MSLFRKQALADERRFKVAPQLGQFPVVSGFSRTGLMERRRVERRRSRDVERSPISKPAAAILEIHDDGYGLARAVLDQHRTGVRHARGERYGKARDAAIEDEFFML